MDFYKISEDEFDYHLRPLFDLEFILEFNDIKCICFWDKNQQQVYFYAYDIYKFSENRFYYIIGFIEYQRFGYSIKIHDFEVFQKKRKGLGKFFLNFFEIKLKEFYPINLQFIEGVLIYTSNRYSDNTPEQIFTILNNFYEKSGYSVSRNNSDYILGYIRKELNHKLKVQ